MPSAASEQSDAADFVGRCLQAFDQGSSFAYAIVETDQIIGYCNLIPHDGSAEIGYWVRSDTTGEGRATSAIRALIAAAFDNLPDVRRIEAHCDESNLTSRRVA